jgi:two-component system, chemotaxis family, chemotaxis protein CheY
MSDTRPRVVVADDEMIMRMFIVSILRKMDYEVVGEASNGNEAIALFAEKKPDLLLLDINMPVKTGEEVLKEVLEQSPNALVIMLTSVVESDTVQRCIELGAAGYIRKDTPVDEIKSIISDVMKEHGGRFYE